MVKHIVITGTSRGIGLELVKQLASQGHSILALSRNSKPCESLNLSNVMSLSCDLSLEEDFDKVIDFVTSSWRKVDILINNAGAILNKPFEETTMEDFQNVYQTNVYGVAEMTRRLIPFMETGSHVVTISSMGGVQGSMKFPGLAAYSSSKGAVITLTELLAEEYKELGIAFNVLALGAVQTEMLEEAFPGYKAPLTAEEMANYIQDFALTGNKIYNGKLLQVSNSTP
ncbi:SDR family NAD(P)-dependent oxidoreductase [Winogradskyella aurantiaca]|uniref:SDR family NAD(P)-dependent oxidoreductase n=1 Tax=Winogradskyella aurantiaca TaxID=2219558 RepID=UPI000E1D641B|nr:SDR family oxidoreductase [Winogradskyella aurantiaca]